MKPDATKHNPDPGYIRELLERAGLNQTDAAHLLGIQPRQMRRYLASAELPAGSRTECPYLVQFALECLAGRKA